MEFMTPPTPIRTPISLTLLSHHDKAQYPLQAYLGQSVGSLLEQLLSLLERGEDAARFSQMRECYEPILERLVGDEAIPLENHQSLEAAGLRDGDTLQIAAHPRKEELLFCRYSKQG